MNKKIEYEKISLMEVEYPSDSMIKHQKEYILTKSLAKKQSLWKKLKSIYWGPGIKAIFYHCESAWLATLLVYAGLCFGNRIFVRNTNTQMALSLFGFPICYLVFSFLSCWLDEQEEVLDLKNSMHYSTTYIVSLRMFYASIVIILCNLCFYAIKGYHGQQLWKIGSVGISSMFLFATVSLYLYHKFSKSYYIGILIGIWAIIAVAAIKTNHFLIQLLLEDIPVAIHGIVAISCFIGFMIYIGKLEKKDAYSFAY